MAIAATAGCATQKTAWEKQGASDLEFNMDAGRCRAQSESVPFAGPLQKIGVYTGCMNGQGWFMVNVP